MFSCWKGFFAATILISKQLVTVLDLEQHLVHWGGGVTSLNEHSSKCHFHYMGSFDNLRNVSANIIWTDQQKANSNWWQRMLTAHDAMTTVQSNIGTERNLVVNSKGSKTPNHDASTLSQVSTISIKQSRTNNIIIMHSTSIKCQFSKKNPI